MAVLAFVDGPGYHLCAHVATFAGRSMPPSAARRPSSRRRWIGRVLALLLVLIGVVAGFANWTAHRRAYAFTHYAPVNDRGSILDGPRVSRPVNDLTPQSVGLPFVTQNFDLGAGETVSTWIIDRPDARGSVVLAPDYGKAKASLLPEAALFHRLGWAVFLIDFRGTGDSFGDTTTLGMREGMDFTVVTWMAQFGTNRGKPVVGYGCGVGAAAILRACSRHLNTPLDGVVLESPFDDLLGVVRGRVAAAGWPEWPTADLLMYWGSREVQYDGFTHRPVDHAADVSCPARVLHGSAEPQAAMAERVFDQIFGPKKLVAFTGAGLQPLIAFDPAKWEAEMTEYLQDVERAYTPPVKGPQFGPNGEPPDPLEVMRWMRRTKM